MKIFRRKDIFAIVFALIAASGAAWHKLSRSAYKNDPLSGALIEAFVVFALAICFIMLAYYSGKRRWKNGDIIVSPWFAVFIGGSLLLFWSGGILADNPYYGGAIVIAIWGSVILSAWGIIRLIRRYRPAKEKDR